MRTFVPTPTQMLIPSAQRLRLASPGAQVCKRVGLPRGTPLRAYEEVKPSPRPRLDSIVTDRPIGSHPDIQDGDIIIFEQALSEVRSRKSADVGHPLLLLSCGLWDAAQRMHSGNVCTVRSVFTTVTLKPAQRRVMY